MRKILTVTALVFFRVFSLAAQSAEELYGLPVVDIYRYILYPRTILIRDLEMKDREYFAGYDGQYSFNGEGMDHYDSLYALFAADDYSIVNNSGFWYGGVYGRQSDVYPDYVPVAFTFGFTINNPETKWRSLAFDWAYFGISDNADDDRNYLAAGIWGLQYGIGFHGLGDIEYHSFGIYDMDVLTGSLTGLLKSDSTGGNLYTDLSWRNIPVGDILVLGTAAFFQFLEDGQAGTDYFYFWQEAEMTLVERPGAIFSVTVEGGVIYREEWYPGGTLSLDLVLPRLFAPGDGRVSYPLWIRTGVGYNDLTGLSRLEAPNQLMVRLICGIILDWKERDERPTLFD